MRIYITGVSGTGKTTTIEKLRERGIHTIDLDGVPGLCRWVHKVTKETHLWHPGIGQEFFDSHDYICDKQRLIELMGSGNAVVAGLADNQSGFFDLFDKLFLFHCDEEIFLQRVRDRTNHDFGKDDSEQEMIRGWYKEFEQEMLDAGAISVDASQPTDVIVAQLLSELAS